MLITKKIKCAKNHSYSNLISALTETLVLTGLGLLGYSFLSKMPDLLILGVTWIIMGPLLITLHYGISYSLLSIMLSLVGLYIAGPYFFPWASVEIIPTLFLVMLWFAIIVGGFRRYWVQRIAKLTTTTEYQNQQLSEITKAYALVNISHDRLQELMVSEVSLRDAMLRVKRILSTDKTFMKGDLSIIGSVILNILSDYGDIHQASLFHVNKDHSIDPVAIGFLGNSKILIKPNEPLLVEALKTKKTVSHKDLLSTESEFTGSLVLAIPLTDSSQKVHGIVAVHQMPFRSYQPENIKLIATLAGYIGDLLAVKEYSVCNSIEDTSLYSFITQVQRCIDNVSNYNICSIILVVNFKNKAAYEYISELFSDQIRGLDKLWSTNNHKGNPIIFLLMPITSEFELESFMKRIAKFLYNELNIDDFSDAGVIFYKILLSENQNAKGLMKELEKKFNFDLFLETNLEKINANVYEKQHSK